MSLPAGYRPRKGDVLLIRAEVRFDVDVEDPDVHLKIVGAEHKTVMLSLDVPVSIYSFCWTIGQQVRSQSDVADVGEVVAVHERWVWVRPRYGGAMLTFLGSEIEPAPGPAPAVVLPSAAGDQVYLGPEPEPEPETDAAAPAPAPADNDAPLDAAGRRIEF